MPETGATDRSRGTSFMPLQFVVDSLDSIPAELRGNYKEADGKFRLDVDGYEDPVSLKSALQKERDAAKAAAREAGAWKSLGKTPEEIQAALEAQAKAEHEKLSKAGEWDKIKAQITEQHQGELSKEKQFAQTLRGQLERHLVDAAAATALAAAEGNAPLLMPHVKAKVKVIEESGEFLVRVVDAAGNPRVDGKGEFLSIADLVSEMRQNPIYAPGFPKAQGSNAPGSASGAASRGQKTYTRAQFAALSPVQQAAVGAAAAKGEASISD